MKWSIFDFRSMKFWPFFKRFWPTFQANPLTWRSDPWGSTVEQFARDCEYWRARAKHAESLLTGETSITCGHRIRLEQVGTVERTLRYHGSCELQCVMPPHSGGMHGALGFRWDDTGELQEDE